MKFNRFAVIAVLMSLSLLCSCQSQAEVSSDIINNESSSSVNGAESLKGNSDMEFYGMVKYSDEKSVFLDEGFKVLSINAKEGQIVNKGYKLIDLESANIFYDKNIKEIEIDKSKKNIAFLEKELNTINKHLSNTEDKSEYLAQQEKLQNLKENCDLKSEELMSFEELFKMGAISSTEIAKYRLEFNQMKNELISTELSIESNKNDMKSKKSKLENDLSLEKNNLKILEMAVGRLTDSLNQSFLQENSIVANEDNLVITSIKCNEGELTHNNMNMMSLVNLNDLIIQLYVTEEYIKYFEIGKSVDVSPISDSSKIYKGNVSFVSDVGVVRNNVSEFLIELKLNDISDIKINMNVNVYVNN